jgi:hypothetical protein
MSPLTEHGRQENVIAFGRAMVKLLEGVDYLYPESRRVERLTLKIVRCLYRKRLRELIALMPPDAGAEILAASENITGPVGDVSLN